MNRPAIAIIGAGQIGSRHLQALAHMDRPLSVYVVDPAQESLQSAQRLLHQTGDAVHNHNVLYLTELDELPDELDVVIIATNSRIRRIVAERLLSMKRVRYLVLEKVLFQHPDDYRAIRQLLDLKQVSAWVNCPMRLTPFYRQLRAKLTNAANVDYRVSAANLAIGSNAIHHLDLFAFLTDRYDFSLDSSGLDESLLNSKRSGFVEFTGTLRGSSSVGQISIASYMNGQAPMLIQITSESLCCIIRTNENKAWISEADEDWTWKESEYSGPLQSKLTHHVVRELLDTGDCGLTAYAQSCELHLPLLTTLLEKYQAIKNKEEEICPIT